MPATARLPFAPLTALCLVALLGPWGCKSRPSHCLDEDGEITDECPVCAVEDPPGRCYDGPRSAIGVGRCVEGEWTCVFGRPYPICGHQVLPGVEEPGDDADEDCDGRADEGTSIACADCGDESSISLGELALRGDAHPIVVRLEPLAASFDVPSVRRAVIAERVREVTDRVLTVGAPALRDVRPLAVPGFTAVADIASIQALSDDGDVRGIIKDFALSTHLVESDVVTHASEVRERSAISGRGVRVAIVDTGVDYTHPAFGACPEVGARGCAVTDGWDFTDGDSDPMDVDGHGTHMASIVAGRQSPGLPSGVAPGAELVALRVDVDEARRENFGQLVEALTWVADNERAPIQVVVVGHGTDRVFSTDACIDLDRMRRPGGGRGGLLQGIVDQLARQGTSVVFPSGNGASLSRMSYPACLPGVVAIGATYDADAEGPIEYPITQVSIGGPARCVDAPPILRDMVPCFSNHDREELDMVAPGASIRAAGLMGGTRELSGTSAAAAHVGGALALVIQEEPRRNPGARMLRLRATSELLRDERPRPADPFIVRRLDLLNAIEQRCSDRDGDGVGGMGDDCPEPLDCDDGDPLRHPGRAEFCNGADDDCDGRVDEDFEVGGFCASGENNCRVEGALICAADGRGTRCDVEAPLALPEACNGVDDDCDGVADEGLARRVETFFVTGEGCCARFEDNGVDIDEPPRRSQWFDAAASQIIEVRVRYACDGHLGCYGCDEDPDQFACDNPEPQGNERITVSIEHEDGQRIVLGTTEDLNGGGGDDWRAPEQQCRSDTRQFPQVNVDRPGRWRVVVEHAGGGPSDSVLLQTSRAEIRCP